MVNLKAISILLILLVLYISVIYNGVRESFTSKKTVKKGNEEGKGAITLDNKLIEHMHVTEAYRVLNQFEMIEGNKQV